MSNKQEHIIFSNVLAPYCPYATTSSKKNAARIKKVAQKNHKTGFDNFSEVVKSSSRRTPNHKLFPKELV